jgi:hypothetical protein
VSRFLDDKSFIRNRTNNPSERENHTDLFRPNIQDWVRTTAKRAYEVWVHKNERQQRTRGMTRKNSGATFIQIPVDYLEWVNNQ